MEGSDEADEAVLARVPFGQFHCGFDRFGSAVAEKHFLLEGSWSYLDQFS